MPDNARKSLTSLSIDAGNSRIKVQLFKGGSPHAIRSAERSCLNDDGAQIFAELVDGLPELDCISVSCARLGDEEVFRRLLEPLNSPLHFLHRADPSPLNHFYTKGSPGPDRLAAAIGLHDFYPGEPAISIDFGTATNTVMVDADGGFLGGAILPGIRAQVHLLNSATGGSLPIVDPAEPVPVKIPDGTQASIRLGVILGHAGALDRLVRHHLAVLGDESVPILVTGGNANLVVPHLGFAVERAPNLVLHGLACWARQL
ncbi:MAG: type III pantothenate kinase [Candidatus Sumerlaeia bacterium]|nr:type III pantothenate kinase [Candidatus Sumerlaeia bacterium]